MPRLFNVQKIVTQDYPDEFQDLINRLGGTLNPFMVQLTDIINGNIDFDNLYQNTLSFEITVDENGTPTNTDSVNVGRSSILGLQVINVQNLTNSQQYVNSQPFISFEPQGNGLITLNNISGLQSGQTYQITVIVY